MTLTKRFAALTPERQRDLLWLNGHIGQTTDSIERLALIHSLGVSLADPVRHAMMHVRGLKPKPLSDDAGKPEGRGSP